MYRIVMGKATGVNVGMGSMYRIVLGKNTVVNEGMGSMYRIILGKDTGVNVGMGSMYRMYLVKILESCRDGKHVSYSKGKDTESMYGWEACIV